MPRPSTTTPKSRLYPIAIGMDIALAPYAPLRAPFASKASVRAVGLPGFQPFIPVIAVVDENSRKLEVGLLEVMAAPAAENLIVHVGRNLDPYLVTTASFLLPVIAYPPRKRELVALCQVRVLIVLELRMTVPIFPDMETGTIIPSLTPFNFVTPTVSPLLPNKVNDPSFFPIWALISVSLFPIRIVLLKPPTESDLLRNPALPDEVEITPAILIPFLVANALRARTG